MQDRKRQPKSPTDPVLERALSHPKRLEILEHLKKVSGANEGELVEALGLAPSKVKYHLAVLQSADLVAHLDRTPGGLGQYVATASAGT